MLPASMHLSHRLVHIIDNRMGFSWTSPLSPRPYWLDDLPVTRLHKINHNKITLKFLRWPKWKTALDVLMPTTMARIVNSLQNNVQVWLPKQVRFQFSSERWQWWGSSNIVRKIVPEYRTSWSKRAFPDGCKIPDGPKLTGWLLPKTAPRWNVSDASQHR